MTRQQIALNNALVQNGAPMPWISPEMATQQMNPDGTTQHWKPSLLFSKYMDAEFDRVFGKPEKEGDGG